MPYRRLRALSLMMKALYWIAGWLFLSGVVSVWGRELDPAAEVLFKHARDGNGSQLTGTVTISGIMINTPDNEGMTALMHAAKSARNDDELHVDTCQRCLKLGADVNFVDKKGYSALRYAKESGNPKIVEMLIAAGADPNIKPGAGNASSGSTSAGSSSTSAGDMNKGDYLMIGGIVVAVIGGLMLLVAAWQESKGWGIAIIVSNVISRKLEGVPSLLCMAVPLIFVLTHWNAGKNGFLAQIFGLALFFGGIYLGPGSKLGQEVAVQMKTQYAFGKSSSGSSEVGSSNSTPATDGMWMTSDFPKAQKKAKAERKILFLLITGPGWCGNCELLEKKVFSSQRFKDYAAKNIVLYRINLLSPSTSQKDLSPENWELYNKDSSESVPSIIVYDAEGGKIGKLGCYGAEDQLTVFMEQLEIQLQQTREKGNTALPSVISYEEPSNNSLFRETSNEGGLKYEKVEGNNQAAGQPASVQPVVAAPPLFAATMKNEASKVSELLASGADVNARDANGWTALMLAGYNGNRTIVQSLLDKGAEVKATTKKNTTALICASGAGHGEVVQALLDAKADVNAKDADGKTALKYATDKGHTAVVEILKKAGATEEPAPSPSPTPSAAPSMSTNSLPSAKNDDSTPK